MIREGVLTENDHESAEILTDLLCYLKYAATPVRPPFPSPYTSPYDLIQSISSIAVTVVLNSIKCHFSVFGRLDL